MKAIHSTLVLAATLALSACQAGPKSDDAAAAKAEPQASAATSADADAFVAEVNAKTRMMYPEVASAQWVSVTYITQDTQLLAAKANERMLGELKRDVEKSTQYAGLALQPETARAIHLLKLATSMPAPKDPNKLAEVTQIQTRLEGAYGAGKYCKDEAGKQNCRDLGQLEEVLRESRDYGAQLDAWTGWHNVARGMRNDYGRFAELLNEGSRELGFADAGEMWRAGYDMSPAAFEVETDRLWDQVKPLYEQLHCYTRNRLVKKYGAQGSVGGMIPAHLTGNMWAQTWENIWDVLEPYQGVSNLDVTAGLVKQGYDPKKMIERAEDFYVSLGMPKLPASFWERSMLTQPRDRDVVCHASAWDMNYSGDVRIKMCIKPNEEELRTIYHELGHVYYYLAYNHLPPLFQSGAHDGFHEAVGDTMLLALTPGYLHSVGLIGEPKTSQQALINTQMKLALEKVAFLPFGKMIDQWRWGVFSGRIKPENFNQAWWDLRAKYQGVAPAVARTETDFDPGAKYHVPGNTPYTRYFLADILQFQFHRTLCEASGHKGPLHECTFYGNKEAGKRFWAMLQKGQSQAWPTTLKELTGTEQMDASAILDYFAPLNSWLKEQNQGQTCGWAN